MTSRSNTTHLAAALGVLGFATLASAQVSGFGGTAMTGWTPNNNANATVPVPAAAGLPSVSGGGGPSDVLTLTTANNSLSTSYWFNTPQNITNFVESFTYIASNTAGADGMTIAWQNAGTNALGAGGGARGFAGDSTVPGLIQVSPAAALALNIFGTDGTHFTGAQNTTTVGLPNTPAPGGFTYASNTPINFTLSYRQSDRALTETATNTSTNATYTRVWRNVDIQSLVGGATALIGFTGGTGGLNSNQTITNFSFTPGAAPPTTLATITPIAATGYNQNMILSATSGGANVTATMDGGTALTGDTFYERGTNTTIPGSGLPNAGTAFGSASDANHTFVFQPNGAGQNNAVMLDATHTTGNLTLTTPARYSTLSFLLANANGASNVNVTINYAGGATQSATINSSDWFNVNTGIAVDANGRGNTTGGFNNVNNANPRVYQTDLALTDTLDNVLSVDFTFGGTGGNRTAIFGLSGTAVPEPSSMALLSLAGIGFAARLYRRKK